MCVFVSGFLCSPVEIPNSLCRVVEIRSPVQKLKKQKENFPQININSIGNSLQHLNIIGFLAVRFFTTTRCILFILFYRQQLPH